MASGEANAERWLVGRAFDLPTGHSGRVERAGTLAVVRGVQDRAIRRLLAGLRAPGCAIDAESLNAFYADILRRGKIVWNRVVPPIVVLGSPDGRVARLGGGRQKPYLTLAFGADFGAYLADQFRAGSRTEDVSAACALFNLGISLFDRIVDGGPGDRTALLGSVSASWLESLSATEPSPACAPEPGWTVEGRARLAPLRGLIEEFYSRIGHLGGSSPSSLRSLYDLLNAAYRAEAETIRVEHDTRTPEVLASAAARKSILPFQIMGGVARLAAHSSALVHGDRIDEACRAWGSVFSVVDDVADLAKDFASGDANALLLRSADFLEASPLPYRTISLDRLAAITDEAVVSAVSEYTLAMETAEALATPPAYARGSRALPLYMAGWLARGARA